MTRIERSAGACVAESRLTGCARKLDDPGGQWQFRTMIAVEEAVGKLRNLSPERTQRVLALIEDLADLQAIEDKQDVEDARASLAEPGDNISLEQLARDLGV